MTEDTKVTVERVIDQPADVLFEILSNPERHASIDGSGMVVSDEKSNRIQAVGDVFTMNMHAEAMGGDYKMDNHVTGFDQNKLVAWQPAREGGEPAGWEWMWELEPQGPDSTLVRQTYDWGKVDDKQLLQRVGFPVVSAEQMDSSLARLAEVAAS